MYATLSIQYTCHVTHRLYTFYSDTYDYRNESAKREELQHIILTPLTTNLNFLSIQFQYVGRRPRIPVLADDVRSGRSTDEHPHQHPRKNMHEELHDKRFPGAVFQYKWQDGRSNRLLWISNDESHCLSAFLKRRTMCFWDGFIEILASKLRKGRKDENLTHMDMHTPFG